MNTRLASRQLSLPIAIVALVVLVCLMGLGGLMSSAQTTTGTIEGTLKDFSGAAVPDAIVRVTGPDGKSVPEITNADGSFRFSQLAPGRYTVTVERSEDFAGLEKTNVEVIASRTTKLTLEVSPAPVSAADDTQYATGSKIPQQELTSAKPIAVGDALEFKVDTSKFGTIKAYLPNDIRLGDTVSGSLLWEKSPVGATETVKVESADAAVTSTGSDFTMRVPTQLPVQGRSFVNLALLAPPVTAAGPTEKATLFIPLNIVPSAGPDDFDFPPMTQQGRASRIYGPFDGDSSNTKVSIGTGNVIKPLAESPRTLVFIAPVDVTGPYPIEVKDGDRTFNGNSRNLAVNLSAPKTNLMRGEKTTVTIRVSGLQGIIKDTPLQLDARGVITMDGGNFQNLRIKPEEVGLDGSYSTTRTVTGIAPGSFSVTATVIVGPFDVCLQDDAHPDGSFRWNTFTGDYAFTKPAPPKPPGGTVQPGGTTLTGTPDPPPPTGVNLTGIGKPAMKGCIITLSHNAPDRRIFARLDTCTRTGDAQVETKSPKTTAQITDKNTADNSCPSSPPK